MTDSWPQRVAIYLDQIEQTAMAIELILEQTQLESPSEGADKVQQSTRDLEDALADLEQRIAEREDLLRAPDAPAAGATLEEKLSGTGVGQDAQLATRCQQIASLIDLTHHRAISLFVCQYHLSELSTEIVRLMVGANVPATYGESTHAASRASGGGLFNESA